MKEIIKIERFLEVLKDTWENQKPQIEMEGFSRYVEFTMFVSPDFGNYPDLIDFEAELLTVDEKLIKDKIKNINSICDKMRKDYDFVMQNRKIEKFYPIGSNNEKLSSTIHTAVHGLAPTCSGDVTIKLLFDDNDLINTIEKIKAIVDQPKPENKKSFADYLICDDKDKIIKKISKANRSTPQSIYFILKALFDNELLVITNNETIYKAYHAEFGYHKDYEALKGGLNYYEIDKPDTKNQQKIGNMYEYLTS